MSEMGYVSRAEGKIADAVEFFSFDFRGKIVLDIGSSTGGFTEFALNAGAKKVIAVEKGTNQMKAPLRFDSRVQLLEKTDIFDVFCGNVEVKDRKMTLIEIPDVIVADVSFVSLRKILQHAKKAFVGRKTAFLVMLKPQFEAKSFQLNRGIVKNEKIRREIIKEFEIWLKRNDFFIVGKKDNNILGKNGNHERFYYLFLNK